MASQTRELDGTGIIGGAAPRSRPAAAPGPHPPRPAADGRLTKTLPRVSTEMALQILACNLTRVLNIMGSRKLLAAIPA
ncbi:hypothetical protein [Methylobacterium sp. XJLW]|uniref:hypothetical protein n=1 Tax=Methylobacterium sp. XJLW TaxID=739141 RepID=UPI001060A9BD|nr:hypothetical protein [Methylobacterium sp. XJLW]